jgi:hypothetical protein
MRVIRLALAALFAVLAFSAMAATSASAFHPLFLTLSGKPLLFLGLGVDPILRGEVAKVQSTILCEKVLVHGLILHLSTLVHFLKIIFHGKCVQKIGTGNPEACTEPIETKPILGELGLLLLPGLPSDVVILLRPEDGTTNFANVVCGTTETKVGGVIVGEIPELDKNGQPQIEVLRETLEIVFATVNKNNVQRIKEIDLLGVNMTKQELSVEGLFGGAASEEATVETHANGPIRIDLKHP